MLFNGTDCRNGQNIAAYFPGDNPAQSLDRAITDWYNEVNDWDFDANGPKSSKPVLHFTQVVWRRTKLLVRSTRSCLLVYTRVVHPFVQKAALFASGRFLWPSLGPKV